MNQKVVIYIILSAILLYLYYRKKDFMIFAAFVVMVAGTMFASKREGFGMGGGGKKGGGGIDKTCAKMGFKQPKIDKKDINGSLEIVMKNIEEVAETKWPFEKGDIEGKRTKDKTVEANWKVIKDSTFMKDWSKGVSQDISDKKGHKEYEAIINSWGVIEELYNTFIKKTTTDEEKTAIVKKHKEKLDKMIEDGPIIIEFINKLKQSDEIKGADDGVKDILKYITCLIKQWISIITGIKKATADEGGGDEEKPTKNKKKSTNKKKSKKSKKDDDADDDDAEDE
jgi:hypothetical protein